MKSKMSIIVPIYRIRENYLRECIESIINQTLYEIEIHLIDDGSPDNCGSICDQYAERDSRIWVHHCKNGGQSQARNIGIKASTAEYIVFVDGDDWLEVDCCEKIYNTFLEDKTDVVVFGYYYSYVNARLPVLYSSKQKRIVELNINNMKEYQNNALYLTPYSIKKPENDAAASTALWNKAYRTDFLRKNDLFCVVGISPFEDNIFLSKLYFCKPNISYLNSILYNYRINKESVTQRKLDSNKELDNLCLTLRSLDEVFYYENRYRYLVVIFAIMRMRQVFESYCKDSKESIIKKSYWIKNALKRTEIKKAIKCFVITPAFKRARGKHKLLGILFEFRFSLLLTQLLTKKNNNIENKSDLIRYD